MAATVYRVTKGRHSGEECLLESRKNGYVTVRLGRDATCGTLLKLRRNELVCVQSLFGGRALPKVLVGKVKPVLAVPLICLHASGKWVALNSYPPATAAMLCEVAANPGMAPVMRPLQRRRKVNCGVCAGCQAPSCGACECCQVLELEEASSTCLQLQCTRNRTRGDECEFAGCALQATQGLPSDPLKRAYFCEMHAPQGTVSYAGRRLRKVQGRTVAWRPRAKSLLRCAKTGCTRKACVAAAAEAVSPAPAEPPSPRAHGALLFCARHHKLGGANPLPVERPPAAAPPAADAPAAGGSGEVADGWSDSEAEEGGEGEEEEEEDDFQTQKQRCR